MTGILCLKIIIGFWRAVIRQGCSRVTFQYTPRIRVAGAFVKLHDDLNTVEALIAQYAAGILPVPARVLVEAHLEIKASSRPLLSTFEACGGQLLEEVEPETISSRASRLDAIFGASQIEMPPAAVRAAKVGGSVLPQSIIDFVGYDLDDIPWKTKLPGFKEHIIGDIDGCEVSMFWIRPGRAIPKHTHGGCELSLVLDGAFNDANGRFGRGDISVADDSIDHRPVAEKDRPCIGFAVVDAPLRLTGSLRQLIGDLIG